MASRQQRRMWRNRGLALAGIGGVLAGAWLPLGSPANVRVSRDAGTAYASLTGSADRTISLCGRTRFGQDEPSIAIDPNRPDVVVVGANDLCAGTDQGYPWMGMYRSTDGGETWSDALVPGYRRDGSGPSLDSPQHGTCVFASDPAVSFDRGGSLFFGFICLAPATGAGSRTAPVEAGGGPPAEDPDQGAQLGLAGPGDFASSAAYVATFDADGGHYLRSALVSFGDAEHGVFEDKIDLTVDQTDGPGAGNVYVAWAEYGSAPGPMVMFARSTDHGATFSTPIRVDAADDFQQFVDLAVGPDGTLYAAFRARDRLLVSRSTDQGRSFRLMESFTIRPFESWYFSGGRQTDRDCGDAADACLSGYTFPRFLSQPAITVDGSGVHLIWSEGARGGQGRIVALNSPDGVRWPSRAIPLDAFPAGHEFMPAIGSTDGVLAALFYDSRRDPAYAPRRPPGNRADGASSGPAVDVVLARSTDGGSTWNEIRVTSRPMVIGYETVDRARVPFIGDYLGVSGWDGRFAIAWTDTRDVRAGVDRRSGESDPPDGFDVYMPCTFDPNRIDAVRANSPRRSDPCLRAGGLDVNVYASVVGARSTWVASS